LNESDDSDVDLDAGWVLQAQETEWISGCEDVESSTSDITGRRLTTANEQVAFH